MASFEQIARLVLHFSGELDKPISFEVDGLGLGVPSSEAKPKSNAS